MIKFCKCGCGQEVKNDNTFINHHCSKFYGKQLTKNMNNKMREMVENKTWHTIGQNMEGENNPMFGVNRKGKCFWVSKRNHEQIGDKNPFFGMHHTQETKNKVFNTKIKNGTYCKFNWNDKFYPDLQMNFKSSWEANIARIFNFLNIKWEYEPKVFNLDGIKYCPDFYLKELDFYIEVKGYPYPQSMIKFNKFAEQYPIELINETKYNEWIKDYPLVVK